MIIVTRLKELAKAIYEINTDGTYKHVIEVILDHDGVGIITQVRRGIRHRRSITSYKELADGRINHAVERLQRDVKELESWA